MKIQERGQVLVVRSVVLLRGGTTNRQVMWMDGCVCVCVFFDMFGVLMILIGVGWRLVGGWLELWFLVVLVLKLLNVKR